MFGLETSIAALGTGEVFLVVALRRDPARPAPRDRSRPPRRRSRRWSPATSRTRAAPAASGFAWGLGHATSLFVFGVPIVLFKSYLPERGADGRRGRRSAS